MLPSMTSVFSEAGLRGGVAMIVMIVEAAAAVVIFTGAMTALARFVVRAIKTRDAESFVPVRLDMARFLALGLEFQLAADLLRTAVAPSFTEIGKLAAVAAIRTGLNFFLAREIRDERAELGAGPQPRA